MLARRSIHIKVRLKPTLTLITLFGLALIFFSIHVYAAEKDAMNARPVLPSEAQGWKWDGKEEQYDTKTLYKYINGAAEVYLSYGFQGLVIRRFEKPDKPLLTAEVYTMGSSADAYGVFAFERQDEEAGIGQGSEFGGGLLRFWKGSYFVSIYAEGEDAQIDAVLLDLGKHVAESIKVAGSKPALIGLLPGKSFGLDEANVYFFRSHVLLNQRFFVAHQNILQMGPDVEAALGHYDRGGQRMHLILLRYPTEKRAQEALQSFSKAYMPEARAKGSLRTEDGKWTMARGSQEFVVIAFSAASEADAEKLVNSTEANIKEKTK